MSTHFSLTRTQPELQGIASSVIMEFIKSVEEQQLELHSFMLLRHGHVVAESWWNPYKAELPHMMFSLSKSFTSTAIGLAVAEGILTLDDQVISYFPEEVPSEVSENLAAMQIRHLLMMGTGHAVDTMSFLWVQEEGNWAKAFFSVPVEHTPGTQFLYNTGATYMLSAILQKASGQKLLDYLQPRFLEPLNIVGATWTECPRGIHAGGFGLSITTEDIAKFGQLYLQKGIWNGVRILPEGWIEEATAKQISNGDGGGDWAQGYGYQFWRSQHGAYRGDGAFGQYCIILPEQDAVIAITSGLSNNNMQAVLNQVWNIVLPAMQADVLVPNEVAAASLKANLDNLSMLAAQTPTASTREKALSKQVYKLEKNNQSVETFSIHFEQDEATVIYSTSDGEHTLRLGRDLWLTYNIRDNGLIGNHKYSSLIFSSFTWRGEDTLVLTVRYVETPFYQTIICRLEGNEIVLEQKMNVSFGPNEPSFTRGKLIEVKA